MYARRNYIAAMDAPMDFQLSLLPPSPRPSLVEDPQSTSMPLSPEATYNSKEELYRAIQVFAAQHSYAFRIGRSNKINNSPRLKIFYNYDRYGPLLLENYPQDYLQARK